MADAADGQVESAPASAVALFGPRLPLAERYARHLATTAVEWGLIGPREVPRLWTRHILNCAVVGELLPPGSEVVDIGSGAGLPGVALAIARPDVRVTLVEPLERRVAWLEDVVADLGLEVSVRRARAEELAGSLVAPVVTARAVAPLRRLATWGLPLTAPGGELLAIKGQSAPAELEATVPHLRRLGAVRWDVVQCGSALLDVPTTVVRVRVGDRSGAPGRGLRTSRRAPRKGRQ